MHYHDKLTPTDAPILDIIQKRWSSLAFEPIQLKEEEIRSLFEAARWAQSSYNEQPWRYMYAAKGDADRETLESLLAEGNSWAKSAGLLIISFAKKTFARNGTQNRHAMHDLGAASALITLQATSMGLNSHQMAGFDVAHANKALGVPTDFEPGSMMAIGHPADPAVLSEALQERERAPRSRNPQGSFAFRGKWTQK